MTAPDAATQFLLRRVEERRRRATEEATHKLALWGDDNRIAMTRLCRSMPSLVDAVGIDPWEPTVFLGWTCGGHMTAGSLMAARFVLQVWNSSEDWRAMASELGLAGEHLAPFNVVEAMARWDHAHRDAFLAWCELPFLP